MTRLMRGKSDNDMTQLFWTLLIILLVELLILYVIMASLIVTDVFNVKRSRKRWLRDLRRWQRDNS